MREYIERLMTEKDSLIDEMESIEKQLTDAGLSMDKVCRIHREERIGEIESRIKEIDAYLQTELF